MPKIGESVSSTLSPFARHKAKWTGCTRCKLCEKRNKVVLYRGSVPCDILFVGESPGPSENTIGIPFVGPAGKLLDEIIERGLKTITWSPTLSPSPRLGFTNIVACMPVTETGGKKFGEPPKEAVEACSGRLKEMIDLADPKVLVLVGNHAKAAVKWWEYKKSDRSMKIIEMLHPAALLRADTSQYGLMYQRTLVAVCDALYEYCGRPDDEVPF